jgi:hypothetical protein
MSNISSMFAAGIEQVRKSWLWFLVSGIALMVLGIACIGKSQSATTFSILALGWVLAISGVDSTAQLWLKGEMEGKPAGVFTSTASTHGGQETTLLTMMVPLLHLGMLIVGVPYSLPGMIHTEARGGTPYGASTIAGPRGELQPTPDDLAIAKALGRRVAEVAADVRGKK